MSICKFSEDVKSICMEKGVCFNDVLHGLTFTDDSSDRTEFSKCLHGGSCRFKHLRRNAWRRFSKNVLNPHLLLNGWEKKPPKMNLTVYTSVETNSDSDELPEVVAEPQKKADDNYCLVLSMVVVLMLPIAYHFVKHANDLCYYPMY